MLGVSAARLADVTRNRQIAHQQRLVEQIGRFNTEFVQAGRPYLLVGPGRWGSADRWLGIPVSWADISGVGAMIEIRNKQLNADPSQGSHFFQNITSLGIPYISPPAPQDQVSATMECHP